MITQNEEGSELEWICAWVPCAVYPKEREKERGRETGNTITTQNRYKEKKGYICMKNA